MIVVIAKWILNLNNTFPNQIKLITECPGCDKELNIIQTICKLIPKCLSYIKPHSKEYTNVNLIEHCPNCDYEFIVNRLKLDGCS
ncbi:MAG: hypothetical protein LN408_03310 [Candidatus Thermoplasmatota archaeon]|nr:hypothetical protein [Candidatus Thermoplasmatota archaeon]